MTNDRRHRLIAPLYIAITGWFVIFITLLFTAHAADAASRQLNLERKTVKHIVRYEAVRIGIPISLALAVAEAESNFNAKALSHKGARGVMQIMPATAWGEYRIGKELLWDAQINVRLGLHFLKRLLKRYRGRVDLALSYYNGGSGVGNLPRARVLPATRSYVRRVLTLQRRYRRRLWNERRLAWSRYP